MALVAGGTLNYKKQPKLFLAKTSNTATVMSQKTVTLPGISWPVNAAKTWVVLEKIAQFIPYSMF